MSEPGYQKLLPPLIDVAHLGDFDAMVVIRSKTKELAFVMRSDMSDEVFIQMVRKLRDVTQ